MRMKGWIFMLVCSLFIPCGHSQERRDRRPLSDNSPGIAVVELFTSEGCSSCPAADALMPVLKADYGEKVIILSFHVDYWNRLGWKDAYSDAAYSKRQSLYATAFGSDNVYTPQAIVNGMDQTTGSNKQALNAFISKSQSASSQTIISSITQEKTGEWTIDCNDLFNAGQVVNLALVQLHATTNVRSGENGGRTLKHYNVVREFHTLRNAHEKATFLLPEGHPAADFHIVAFLQDIKTMHITAAQETGIH